MSDRGPFRLLRNVAIKALALFVAFNALYFAFQPLGLLEHLTIYNSLLPGRLRLPFSQNADVSYNLIETSLDQMLASHEIAQAKAPGEYRVVLIGDSSVWGYLLEPTQTQAACLNQLSLSLPSGRKLRFYNLGYPTLSVMKDLLILRHALAYQPDLVIWSTTLASLYPSDQLDFEVIRRQYDEVASLQAHYQFKLPQWPLPAPSFLDRTFFGQRRELADWLRYQLYGLDWAATGIDHRVPQFVTPHPVDLSSSDSLLLANPNLMTLSADHHIQAQDLSLDVVQAGMDSAAAKNVPVLLVNEPMVRSPDNPVRWNSYYPRWAYDDYRGVLQTTAASKGWHYLDVWDAVPNQDFTDTDFHMTPAAACQYAARLGEASVTIDPSIPQPHSPTQAGGKGS
ncbi:MAG TPA: SGNH/GDSL hydrolase family protein [Aggregatilineales bacterium]|nr:SGNH/GDSL hydrolase family protein [Aggregatilineales bacterium]